MNERLSAWMDGELDSPQARQLFLRLKHDLLIRRDWDCYHLIRDTMRGVHGPELRAQIYARLAAEPTVLAPKFHVGVEKPGQFASAVQSKVAAVAFIAFVGGVTMQSLWQHFPKNAIVPEAEVIQSAVLTDQRILEYLLAHLHYSTSKALQSMAMNTHVAAN